MGAKTLFNEGFFMPESGMNLLRRAAWNFVRGRSISLAMVLKFLAVNILTAMQNADNHNPVVIRAKVDAPLPVGKRSQAGAYPVSGRAG
jgi:hypothetical protein